ncbi:hypothetical protein DM02DRAFT_177292 [Periconia macrospinosa]|uniref:Uncharacterized protein n=1 Tax=Periconia macrospinosa TaxID=97972 RepID=A0A2V1E1K0_9PLEO|nr:hypothetical protein DM02DRAFT_177292 [Periconia macrospinosa]
MTWWRRDSSLWIRTPIHRYLRRTLSDNETALRTRCFSKSQPQGMKSDEDDVNYSSRLSEDDRIRMRHYKRWQRRVEADPYKALFGASENWLNGKGDKDWQWLSSYSPLWTIRDMGVGENTDMNGSDEKSSSDQKKYKDSETTPESKPNGTYPKKVNITSDNNRSVDALKVDSSSYGVDSPSDSRRVRLHMQSPVNKSFEDKTLYESEVEGGRTTIVPPQASNKHEQHNATSPKHFEATGNDESTRKTSFIDDFLANNWSQTVAPTSLDSKSRVLQTSLQQRESPGFVQRPRIRRHTAFSVVDVSSKSPPSTGSANRKEIPISDSVSEVSPPSKASVATGEAPATTPTTQNSDNSTRLAKPCISKDDSNLDKPRATRDIHRLLPKDDIDFLTADSIRASMGRVKNSRNDGTQSKQKLEERYKEALQNHQIDPLLEWKVLNDQHVRRMQRELTQSVEKQGPPQQGPPKVAATSAKNEKIPTEPRNSQKVVATHPQAPVLETGLDYMMSWLNAGGGFIAHHFFQDPVDVLADQKRLEQGMSTDPFFQGVINGIEKSRRATFQVKIDLVQDMPAFRPLVDRLTNNEGRVVNAAKVIRGILIAPRDIQAKNGDGRVRRLKRDLLATEEEFKSACKAVNDLNTTQSVSGALARRLRVATDALQKTAKLTRVMIFGLQSRLESLEELPPSLRSRYLAHQLLALQDTQLALMRVVLHLMQRYGVDPTVKIENLDKVHGITTDAQTTTAGDISVVETEEEAKKREMKAAADAKLSDEIKTLKTAMQGLSDDGYNRAPKPITRNQFDKPSPLANSLFRPFRSQLDDLGKDTKAETKTAAELRKKKGDRDLVNEIKSIYEDLFGPITIYHRQVSDVGQDPVSASSKPKGNEEAKTIEHAAKAPSKPSKLSFTSQKPPSIQLLKEDEVSPTISPPHQPSTTAVKEPVPESKTTKPIFNPDLASIELVGASPAPIPSNAFPPIEEVQSSPPKETTPTTATHHHHTPIYRIFIYDPTTNEIIIAPSPTPQSTSSTPDLAPPLPLHTALSALTHPSKFLPHLPKPEYYDIITARPNLLVLRSTPHAPLPTEETICIPAGGGLHTPSTDPPNPDINASASPSPTETSTEWIPGINPIDGTTRLSPTGFVGTSSLELEQEFEERRRAAGAQQKHQQQQLRKDEAAGPRARAMAQFERAKQDWERRNAKETKKAKRVGFGGVVRTAIIAGAWCYVVGVGAELSRDVNQSIV